MVLCRRLWCLPRCLGMLERLAALGSVWQFLEAPCPGDLEGWLDGWSGKVISITRERGRGQERQLGTNAHCGARNARRVARAGPGSLCGASMCAGLCGRRAQSGGAGGRQGISARRPQWYRLGALRAHHAVGALPRHTRRGRADRTLVIGAASVWRRRIKGSGAGGCSSGPPVNQLILYQSASRN